MNFLFTATSSHCVVCIAPYATTPWLHEALNTHYALLYYILTINYILLTINYEKPIKFYEKLVKLSGQLNAFAHDIYENYVNLMRNR